MSAFMEHQYRGFLARCIPIPQSPLCCSCWSAESSESKSQTSKMGYFCIKASFRDHFLHGGCTPGD